VVRQVLLHKADNVPVMGAGVIQPEYRGAASGTSSGNGKSNPVSDRQVLNLAHPPYVISLHFMLHIDLSTVLIHHSDGTSGLHFKSFIVRSILLGFLSHQSNVGYISHSSDIELAVLSAVVDDSLVNTSVRPVGNAAFSVLKLVVLVPHLASISHNAGHAGVDDDV